MFAEGLISSFSGDGILENKGTWFFDRGFCVVVTLCSRILLTFFAVLHLIVNFTLLYCALVGLLTFFDRPKLEILPIGGSQWRFWICKCLTRCVA